MKLAPVYHSTTPSQSDSGESASEDMPVVDIQPTKQATKKPTPAANGKAPRKALAIRNTDATMKVRKSRKSKAAEPQHRRPYKSFAMDRLQRNHNKTEVRLLLAVKRKDALQKKYDNYKYEMEQRKLAEAAGVAVGMPSSVVQADL